MTKTIALPKEIFSDAIQKNIWRNLPSKDLFDLLGLDKKNFNFIAGFILNKKEKEDEEAYLYQVKLLKRLSQMKNTEFRDNLLKKQVDSLSLMTKIKVFLKKAKGEAALWGFILYAQYSKKSLTLDNLLISSFSKRNMLDMFLYFLTPDQCEALLENVITAVPFDNTENHKILSEIIQNIENFSEDVQITALERLHSLMLNAPENFISKNEKEIFSLIKKDPHKSSEAFQYVYLKIGCLFIEKVPLSIVAGKSAEILSFLKNSLDNPSEKIRKTALNLFHMFIKNVSVAPVINNAAEIFDLIKNELNKTSEETQEIAMNILSFFMKKVSVAFVLNKENEILNFVGQVLSFSSRKLLKSAALNVLADLISTTSKHFNEAEQLLKEALIKGLDYNSEWVLKALLNVLTVFINKEAVLSFTTNEILNFIKLGLNHPLKSVYVAALLASTALINKKNLISNNDHKQLILKALSCSSGQKNQRNQ